jgi:hypothetical protein
MRPYLETKVFTETWNPWTKKKKFVLSKKPLSIINWQITENIDRIKLPCFCTFENYNGKRHLGEIKVFSNKRSDGLDDEPLYELLQIDEQHNKKLGDEIDTNKDLENLIRDNKINIGKAKIVYYETIGRKPMKQKHSQAKIDSACEKDLPLQTTPSADIC